jgi:endonuclease/exonuclease/phosphatase family metal-dependent hydrolase
MVRLASRDRPAVLLLQELPVWALRELEQWADMALAFDVAQRPRLGPLPSTPELGHVLTEVHHGLLRSAFAGQANAILLGRGLRVVEHRHVVLNPLSFRRSQAWQLHLGLIPRLAWANERRVCQVVRAETGGRTLTIANLHATSYPPDKRVPDAELLRAAVFVDGFARPDEPVLLGGDFNVSVLTSRTLAQLAEPEWGFTGATPTGIDHVLVRGLTASSPERWGPDRRLYERRLLSDHAPVEVEIEL